MRVLIVSANADTAQHLDLMIRSEGMNAYATHDGEEAVDLAGLYDYDVVVIDRRVDMSNQMDVLKQIRRSKIAVSIICAGHSPRAGEAASLLNAGADDYIGLPCDRDEFLARTRAVARRSKGHVSNVITAGPITVDLDRKQVFLDGAAVHMTGKEYQMAEVLALRKNQTVAKESFLSSLYGGMDEPELKIIDVFICKLRKKLTSRGHPDYIDTVWGRGYVLRDEPRSLAAAPHGTREVVKDNPLSSVSAQILIVMAEAGRDLLAGTLALKVNVEAHSVHARIAYHLKKGFVVRAGGAVKETRYEITPAGVQWLQKHGWVRPAVAIAA